MPSPSPWRGIAPVGQASWRCTAASPARSASQPTLPPSAVSRSTKTASSATTPSSTGSFGKGAAFRAAPPGPWWSSEDAAMLTKTIDYATSSAGALAAAVARREVSAVELCEEAIRAIEARDGPINAVVVRDFDRALEQARGADARVARGETGPLIGVPMTVKDSHHVAGLATTWGLEPFKGWTPTWDSTGVARLKAAGAVILGKTNVRSEERRVGKECRSRWSPYHS